jgi:hypothetical protein
MSKTEGNFHIIDSKRAAILTNFLQTLIIFLTTFLSLKPKLQEKEKTAGEV